MRSDAWTYLSIRGLGAPFSVILMTLQVPNTALIYTADAKLLSVPSPALRLCPMLLLRPAVLQTAVPQLDV